ncbi:MAG: ankyrin repeat domain-containing protein [Chitinispirillaceae bacterium]|nr:ankyrin repeat domain-containing protein [Chitinispirillaceae bacterium]
MLKLSSRNNLIICLIAIAFFCNCSEKRDPVQEQKIKLDTVSGIAPEKSMNVVHDTSLTDFNIPIEGYNATKLGQAVFSGDTANILNLIKKGVSIERCLTDETYIYDILYAALISRNLELIKFVLKNRMYTSVNETYNEDAESPLTLACDLPNNLEALEIANLLISLGANANGVGESGGERTLYPLITSINHNNIELTKLLLKHGAKKDVKNEYGETALMIAKKRGFEGIVRLLNKS